VPAVGRVAGGAILGEGELGVERADELTQIARELAWSQRTPEDEEVEEFAEQARGTQDGEA